MKRFALSCMLALGLVVAAAPGAQAQRPQGRGFGNLGANKLFLLSQKSVQQELKLTDDQTKQVSDFSAKQRESLGDLQDLSREERQQKMAERAKAGDTAIAAILNADQDKRLKQISLQQRGGQALADPEVAQSLDLSAEQKEKIQSIQQSSQSETRALVQGGARAEARNKIEALRKSTGEKLLGVLTADQQNKLKELTGEPFKGEITRPQLRGNRGRPTNGPANAGLSPRIFGFASFTRESGEEETSPRENRQQPNLDRRRMRRSEAESDRAGDRQADTAWMRVAQAVSNAPKGDPKQPRVAERSRGDLRDAPPRGENGAAYSFHHRRHHQGHHRANFARHHGRGFAHHDRPHRREHQLAGTDNDHGPRHGWDGHRGPEHRYSARHAEHSDGRHDRRFAFQGPGPRGPRFGSDRAPHHDGHHMAQHDARRTHEHRFADHREGHGSDGHAPHDRHFAQRDGHGPAHHPGHPHRFASWHRPAGPAHGDHGPASQFQPAGIHVLVSHITELEKKIDSLNKKLEDLHRDHR